jgi:hypothetical protein
VQISENYYINFADAGPQIRVNATMVYRYGKDINDRTMMNFGAYYYNPERRAISRTYFFRNFFDLFMQEEIQKAPKGLALLKDVWLPDLQVMTARNQSGSASGLFLAAKGGNNDEHHNHNDVGNFIVYYDGEPLLIDVGSGTYTSRTFDMYGQRYDIWFNRSDFHNVPTVNGTTQRAGITYRASNVRYKTGNSTVEFSLDIAGAYPAEAAINSWIRTVTLNRGKSVQVKDETNLQKATSVVQHLMTCHPAEITKPGEVVIHYQTGDNKSIDFAVKYNAQQMTAKVEKIKFELEEDQGVRARWGDTIYRINFEVIAPKIKDLYLFEIRRR